MYVCHFYFILFLNPDLRKNKYKEWAHLPCNGNQFFGLEKGSGYIWELYPFPNIECITILIIAHWRNAATPRM